MRVSLALQNDLCNGMFCRVREREGHMPGAELGRKFRCLTMKCEGGPSPRFAGHFNIPPSDTMIPSRADCLHGRLFRGKAGGIALHPVSFRFTVANLALGEDPAQKPIAETLDGGCDARYFRNVNSGANDHSASDSPVVRP